MQSGGALLGASFFIMQFLIYQEKPIHKSLAIFFRHTGMITQILLQICEGAFYHVVGVRHFRNIFKGKQPLQIGADADHGRSQSLISLELPVSHRIYNLFI